MYKKDLTLPILMWTVLTKKDTENQHSLWYIKLFLFFFEGGLCFLWPCAVHETNRGIPWRSPAIDRPGLHRVSTFGSRWIFMITSEDYVYSYISLQYKGLASFMIKLHKGYYSSFKSVGLFITCTSFFVLVSK